MAWPIRGLGDRTSCPYHHVQLAFDQLPYHRRSSRRVIGRVAVGHHIDVGINVCKHPADDVALSWRRFCSNYRPRSAGYTHSAISRIVIVDINDSVRQSRTECCYRGADGRLFIATRKDYRHAVLFHGLTTRPAVCSPDARRPSDHQARGEQASHLFAVAHHCRVDLPEPQQTRPSPGTLPWRAPSEEASVTFASDTASVFPSSTTTWNSATCRFSASLCQTKKSLPLSPVTSRD